MNRLIAAQPRASESPGRRLTLNRSPQAPVPAPSPWLVHWFKWYARGYVARHFHSLRVSPSGTWPANLPGPLVIFSNHASWWDPLICALLADTFFPERTCFAPIAAAALEKYRFFRKLGFFPVEQGSRRGAGEFLRTAQTVLQDPQHILWLTPQGRFADVRERPLRLRAELAHLPQRMQRGTFLPLAIEYAFWEEKSPEVLVRFGASIPVCRDQTERLNPKSWTGLFEQQLQQTQDALALAVVRREPAGFECVLRGRTGINWFYDRWRRLSAWLRGVPCKLEHGTA